MAKQEKIKLTAIIKTKNSEDFLCETLEALKNLDEIIILDEHSTDDTIEIAKEYKAHLIYVDMTDPKTSINQAFEEISNTWAIVLEQDEILPLKLLKEIENYTLNPKKNKYFVNLPIKTFYLKKEIKSFYKKQNLRLFRKDCAILNPDFSVKPLKGKVFSFRKSKKNEDNILKFFENNVEKYVSEIFEKNRMYLKTNKPKNRSYFVEPMMEFIKYYVFKKGFLDGRRGFIFAKMKFFEKFLLSVMTLEKECSSDRFV